MAAKRHATFTHTNLHCFAACTYTTLQHGRHTRIHYVTVNNMADACHTTFTTTNLHGVTAYTYVTIQHGGQTKIYFVTANNMADARHTTFANKILHGVPAYTYRTIQQGSHTKIPIYTATTDFLSSPNSRLHCRSRAIRPTDLHTHALRIHTFPVKSRFPRPKAERPGHANTTHDLLHLQYETRHRPGCTSPPSAPQLSLSNTQYTITNYTASPLPNPKTARQYYIPLPNYTLARTYLIQKIHHVTTNKMTA
jgi:hypothetical protein